MTAPHLAAFGLILLALSGCAAPNPRTFSGGRPRLDPMEYFSGTTRSWGVAEDRFGNVRKQFTQKIVGHRRGDAIRLDQTFTFSDGKIERRVWNIRKVGPHRYEGVANDGRGTGESFGNAFRWRYTVAVPAGGKTMVDFDQIMLLQPGRVLINRCTVRKFGIRVGGVSEFFRKDAGE